MTFKEQSEILNRQRIKEWTHLCESPGIYLKKSNDEYKTVYEFFKELSIKFKGKNKKG